MLKYRLLRQEQRMDVQYKPVCKVAIGGCLSLYCMLPNFRSIFFIRCVIPIKVTIPCLRHLHRHYILSEESELKVGGT
jgi:hypothetical protein